MKLRELTHSALTQLKALSPREKGLAAAAAGVALFMIVYLLYSPIDTAFESQAKDLESAMNDASNAKKLLEQYVTLKARRDAIEQDYKEVEIKEGVLSYVEKLIRTKLGLTSGFTIQDRPATPFGGSYEQTTLSVDLTIASLEKLVDFLKEITQGEKPLLLTKLDVRKVPRGDALKVNLDVSSLKKISPDKKASTSS